MEERLVKQYKVFSLVLNTFGRAEDKALVAVAFEREKLIDFYKSQLLEKGYTEDGVFISFKEGRLKRYNPLYSQDNFEPNCFGQGIFEEWVDEDIVNSPRVQGLLV